MHPVISLLALTLTLSRGSMAASEKWHPRVEPMRHSPTFADLLAAGKATQDALRRRRASATKH
jgi:hypothetical protein